ncbi:MAG: SurA N-terminal domain-containing protein [Defluviimonas sp.]|nr:SurA N-terminal domain-containing protein [Defluviimonas sp.]
MAKGLRRKGASTVVWLLMAMLILGLGGFGVTNFGGATQSVATVGEREIDVNDYARALRAELNALSAEVGQPIGLAQAQAFGLDQGVRARLIAAAALDEEAARIGLSVGDAQVHEQIVGASAFRGIDGRFDRELYALALRQQGLSETEFESQLRDEAARLLLQGAVAGGVVAPAAYVEAVAAWAGEARGFEHVVLTADLLTGPVPAPTDEQLAAFHAANPAPFTAPETRVLRYVWLSPEAVLDEVQLDEAALRAEYEARIAEFVQPERRMVERLVFGTEEEAAAAKARIDAGEVSFEDLVNERGLTLQDVDLGEVTREELGAAGDGVFALEGPGVAGPLPSDLGPALYAMNAILLAQEVSFEEARESLSEEVALDRARRMVADRAQALNDLLAGGATLEELAAEAGMELGTVEVTAEGGEGIAAYAEFRETALAASPDDFPELHEMEDGGVFALQLLEVRPPALRPLGEVRAQAVALWTAAETERRLLAEAEALAAAPDLAAAAAERGLEVTEVAPITRDGFVEGLPEGAVDTLFRMAEGEARVLPGTGEEAEAHVLRLTSIAQSGGEAAAQLRGALETQARQGLAQDMAELFTRAVQDTAGVTLNQAAINAVHAQMP